MTSVVLAAAQGAVWADDAKEDEEDAKAEKMDKPAAEKPAAPANGCCNTRKICVQEWVPEWYETTRTCYKSVTCQEKCTAYRYECVQEKRTRTCYKYVPTTCEVEKTICKMVPTVEERTVYEKVPVCKPCTYTVRKCVDKGHYECREVPCGPSLLDRLHSCKKSCCDSCCEPCCQPCRTKTVKVWCPCKVYCEETCTKMVKTYECVAKKCCVTVCKPCYEKVKCCVTTCKCVAHQEEYCVNVKKCIPYETTRCVTKCVPVCEKVKCCRMVCKTVEKEVACCENTCCNTCGDACCGHGHRLFSRHKHSCGGCCETSCCSAPSCCGAPSCGHGCCK
jgi:hypothetical protein